MSSPKAARLVPQPEGTTPEELVHMSSFALIRRGAEVLLVKRVKPERLAGKWCLPGTLLLYGEDPAAAVRRAVRDQLGGTSTSVKLLDVQSYGDRHWDICFVYQVETSGIGKLGEDFGQTDYFDLSLPPPDLRDDHKEVIDMAKSRDVL
ncbi:MAG: NUDIX hydrolase [Thaumarchaeota archaeon]|nr:NUDIX hydrolase [Nitrososphaerota archaeon]